DDFARASGWDCHADKVGAVRILQKSITKPIAQQPAIDPAAQFRDYALAIIRPKPTLILHCNVGKAAGIVVQYAVSAGHAEFIQDAFRGGDSRDVFDLQAELQAVFAIKLKPAHKLLPFAVPAG